MRKLEGHDFQYLGKWNRHPNHKGACDESGNSFNKLKLIKGRPQKKKKKKKEEEEEDEPTQC